jgi:hypothetical protein
MDWVADGGTVRRHHAVAQLQGEMDDLLLSHFANLLIEKGNFELAIQTIDCLMVRLALHESPQ